MNQRIDSHRFYIDTNVFIAAVEAQDEATTELFARCPPANPQRLVTSSLTVAELLVKPYKDNDDRLAMLYENWSISNEVLYVDDPGVEVMRFAAVLRAQYSFLKLPDAIHLSTALGTQCTQFVSFDKALEKISRIEFQRFGVIKDAAMPAYLHPHSVAFKDLLEQF